jgi:hypothetical protein
MGTIRIVPRILRTHAASPADSRSALLETGIVAALPAVTVIGAPWVKLKAVLRVCRQRVERKGQRRHGEKRSTHGLLPVSTIKADQIPPPAHLHRGAACKGSSLCRDGSAVSPIPLGTIATAVIQADPGLDNVLDVSTRSAVYRRLFCRRFTAVVEALQCRDCLEGAVQ